METHTQRVAWRVHSISTEHPACERNETIGDIAFAWEKQPDRYAVQVRAPEGTTAQVWLPEATVQFVDGDLAALSAAVVSQKPAADGVILTLSAGEHDLIAEGAPG